MTRGSHLPERFAHACERAQMIRRDYGNIMINARILRDDLLLQDHGWTIHFAADANLLISYYFGVADRKQPLLHFAAGQLRCRSFFRSQDRVVLLAPYYVELRRFLEGHYSAAATAHGQEMAPEAFATWVLNNCPVLQELVGMKVFQESGLTVTERVLRYYMKEISSGEEQLSRDLESGALSPIAALIPKTRLNPDVRRSDSFRLVMNQLIAAKSGGIMSLERDAEAVSILMDCCTTLRRGNSRVLLLLASEDRRLLEALNSKELLCPITPSATGGDDGFCSLGRGLEYFMLRESLERENGDASVRLGEFLQEVTQYRESLSRLDLERLRVAFTGAEPDEDTLRAYEDACERLLIAMKRIYGNPAFRPDDENIERWLQEHIGVRAGTLFSADERTTLSEDLESTSMQLRSDMQTFTKELKGFVGDIDRLTAHVVLPPHRHFMGLEYVIVWSPELPMPMLQRAEKALRLMKEESARSRMEGIDIALTLRDELPESTDVACLYAKILRMMHLYSDAEKYLRRVMKAATSNMSKTELEFQLALTLKKLAVSGTKHNSTRLDEALGIIESLCAGDAGDPRFWKERAFLNWYFVEKPEDDSKNSESIVNRRQVAEESIQRVLELLEAGGSRMIDETEKRILRAAAMNDLAWFTVYCDGADRSALDKALVLSKRALGEYKLLPEESKGDLALNDLLDTYIKILLTRVEKQVESGAALSLMEIAEITAILSRCDGLEPEAVCHRDSMQRLKRALGSLFDPAPDSPLSGLLSARSRMEIPVNSRP